MGIHGYLYSIKEIDMTIISQSDWFYDFDFKFGKVLSTHYQNFKLILG